MFPAAPLFFRWMCDFNRSGRRSLAQLRAGVSIGDVLSADAHAAFNDTFGVALWQSYGASEAGPVLLNRSATVAADEMALGTPYPEVDVSLSDLDDTPPVDGTPGEIVVRSPAVGLGYLDGTSFENNEFRSGDLAVRRGNELCFAGRKKLLITRAGKKIDPHEVEEALRAHPDVTDAAVRTGIDRADRPLEAWVVASRPVATEELIAHCAKLLEAYKVPRHIEFRDRLPRNAAGKLQRGRF